MSIIYDALKKVERQSQGQRQNVPQIEPVVKEKKHSHPQLYFLYALIVGIGLLIGNVFFSFLARSGSPLPEKVPPPPPASSLPEPMASPQPQAAVANPPVQAPSPQTSYFYPSAINTELQESLVLNGVFFSKDEGYALVNNQIVREGDIISGAVVKRITLGEVELEAAGLTIKLSTGYSK